MKIFIGGKQRGIKFNNYGLEQMIRKAGEYSDIEAMYAAIWGGLRGYSFAMEEPVDYKWNDVIDWVDDLMLTDNQSVIAEVMQSMTETQTYKKLVKGSETEKKNTTA